MLRVRLAVHNLACETSLTLPASAEAAQISGDQEGDVLVVRGASTPDVERFLESVRRTHRRPLDLLVRTPTGAMVRGRNPPGVVTTIARSGCVILWPSSVKNGVHTQTILAPDSARLQDLVKDLEALGPVEVLDIEEVSLDSIPISVNISDLTSPLTARQLEVLRLAQREGYFDVPRRVTGVELGARLGVSRSTVDEHLRKANRAIVKWFVQAASSSAVLSAGAHRGRGRPRKRVAPRKA